MRSRRIARSEWTSRRIDENAAAGKIAENFFSQREVGALRALPRENQTEGFFNCWTRKEACVKALGVGLSQGLRDFEVSLRPDEPVAIVGGIGWTNWSLFSFRPSAGYVAALAVEGRDVRVVGPRII
jgi:4'-phosphopantetheinyl transferase